MSYSFSVKGSTKAEALDLVAQNLDEIVASQPIHEHDRPEAQGAVEAFIGLLPNDENMDVSVSVTGSIMSRDEKPYSVSLSVSAYLADRIAETTTG